MNHSESALAIANRVKVFVIHDERDRADAQEVARQVADKASSYQRAGWTHEDYLALNQAVYRAVLARFGM